jgi:single-strand selective monofunctional uracil DNA glycosylase
MPSALARITKDLAAAVDRLRFAPPVSHVYNPLDYAWPAHAQYLERYGRGTKRALWLGMNPGPFGMAQTGVPFGEIAAVRDFLGVTATVGRPAHEHPKRPIEGFACQRSEVSGKRLWGFIAQRFGRAEAFFATHFVHNYCPLVFMDEGGRNLTPDKLPAAERDALYAPCDQALREVTKALGASVIVAVGHFAETRARVALGDAISVRRIPHPSPASPLANRGWAEAAAVALGDLAPNETASATSTRSSRTRRTASRQGSA